MNETKAPPLAVAWGQNLRAAREAAGMTQAELGEKVGADQFTLSKLENGRHRPSDGTKIRLARALGCTVESLFSYDSPVAS